MLVFATTVHCGVVLVHNVLSFLAVGLDDEFLHLLDGEVHGDHFCDAEECALEDGVGAVAQSDLACDLGCVDVVDGDVVLSEVTLHLVWQVCGQLIALPDGVEKEGAAVAQTACHVIHVQVGLYVACHEVWCCHQICGADGRVAEAEVRTCETAGFLGVVGEISLTVFVGVVTDDLDGVLVGSDSAVGSETEEFGFVCALVAEGKFFLGGQRGESHVVDDAHGEVVLGLGKGQILEH